jgi:hypothetical protein
MTTVFLKVVLATGLSASVVAFGGDQNAMTMPQIAMQSDTAVQATEIADANERTSPVKLLEPWAPEWDSLESPSGMLQDAVAGPGSVDRAPQRPTETRPR